MSYQKVTTTGFGDRIKNAFGGIITSIILIIAGTCLLWWNEGRTVKQSDAILEAKSQTQDVKDISKIDINLDGKLIHAQGLADTKDIIGDSELNIQAKAIRMNRKVEYYQYNESSSTKKEVQLGGKEVETTTYTYSPKWSNEPINSLQFKDPSYQKSNFVLTTVENQKWIAPNVSFGAYALPEFLINRIGGAKSFTISNTEEVSKIIKNKIKLPIKHTEEQVIGENNQTSVIKKPIEMVHVQNNIIYLGVSPNQPAIGDVKISYEYILPTDISVIAKVTGNSFEPFRASNGNNFSRLSMGKISSIAMFEDAQSSNMVTAWLFRLIGFIVIIAGFKGILAPLHVLASVIPILGTIIGAGTGIVAFAIGSIWSLLIIAIAWLRYRPMLSVILIAIAVALFIFLYKRGKKIPPEDIEKAFP